MDYSKYNKKVSPAGESSYPRFFKVHEEMEDGKEYKFKCLDIREVDGQYGPQVFYNCALKKEDGSTEQVTLPVRPGSPLMKEIASQLIDKGDVFYFSIEENAYEAYGKQQRGYHISKDAMPPAPEGEELNEKQIEDAFKDD